MKRSEMEETIEDIIDHGMYLGASFAQIAENILHIQLKKGMLPPETIIEYIKQDFPHPATPNIHRDYFREWEDESPTRPEGV